MDKHLPVSVWPEWKIVEKIECELCGTSLGKSVF